MTNRKEMLLKMYDQMFNDINRHILVVWQSVGVLVGAFAIFALVEKKIVTLDVAVSIILLLSAWLLAHLFDAAYWYNRNLVIIANIERQFLKKSDLKNIQYYFGSHRQNNKMIEHLRIQLALGLGLGGIVLIYHFIERIFPNIVVSVNNFNPNIVVSVNNFDPIRALPYLLIIVCFFYLRWLKKHCNEKYDEFMRNSPGIEIDTNGINYGVGHAHDKS